MKELHVKCLLPVRMDKYLMDQFPALSMGRLNKALRENKIKLNGKKQPLSTRVQNGDSIRLFLTDEQLENRPTPAAVFVYEDDDIIIANKPAGIAVDGPDSDTLVRRVQAKLAAEGKPTHAVLCHRLDTGTSGLVLLAKSSAAEAFLTAAIKSRAIEKRYLCVTFGRPNPPAALLRDYLLKDAERGIVRITDTTAGGAKEAQQAVADDLTQRSGDTIRPENIFFTCGAAPALVAVLRALAVEDAEFVAIAPYFPEYQVFVSYNGGKFVEVPPDTKNFQVDIAAVERALTPHTQAVLVNSPNNPSGVIYSRETLTALGALLERKSAEYGHPIYIIADEPYRELVYDNAEVPYIPGIYRDTVICYSYSKSLSMPGERIGYVCIPDSVTDSAKLHAAVAGASRAFGHVCAPSMMQRVIARATGLRPDLEAYDKNRHTLYNALSEMGYECVKPEGAFYMMVKAPGGDAHAFSERAKKENLLLVPADSFGCPGFFRISTCVDPAMIQRSLPAFRRVLQD